MASRSRYFIKIPASPSEGVVEHYIQVDPKQLHLGILTEIYTLDPRSQKYYPALGAEGMVTTGINPATLLDRWQELTEQIDQTLVPNGLAGTFAAELQSALAKLPEFIVQLSDGSLGNASKILDAIAYSVMAAASNATSNLVKLEAKADEQSGLAEAMVLIVADRDDENVFEATADALAGAIDNGLRALRTLANYETELDALCCDIEPMSRSWSSFTTDTPPMWLRDQLDWMDGDEGGFCTRASHYLISSEPDAVEMMGSEVAEARARIRTVYDRLSAAQSDRAQVKARTEERLGQQVGTDQLVRTVRSSRETVDKYRKGGVDTYSVISGLINADEMEQWEGFLRDRDWQSLHAVTVRLRDKSETVRRLLDQAPSLREEDRKVISRTEQYIERIQATLGEFGLELDEAEAESTEDATTPIEDVVLNPELDENRLEEIYELMMAVGAVKFCKPQNFNGSTPKAILEVLEGLGRITGEELKLYMRAIENRLVNDSYQVSDDENRLNAWHETDPDKWHWIQFRQKSGKSGRKRTLWRLAEQAKETALGLCVTHNLTPNDIVKACEARRTERERLWRQSRAD